ncbi:hypothetical protein [Pantanalinema sp. GBBB05]
MYLRPLISDPSPKMDISAYSNPSKNAIPKLEILPQKIPILGDDILY